MTTRILAEPGCTAEGDHLTYLRLIDTAAQGGATIWKPQWVSDPAQMCERRHIGVDHPKRAYYERAYRWLSFPVDWHVEFKERCQERGLQYACTVFLPQDAATVAPFVDYLKISSFEAADAHIFEEALSHKIPILMSLGMRDEEDVDDLCEDWHRVEYLHCVSAYPAPLEAVNLRCLRHRDGYSDHSRHLWAGAIAVACGATIIETHYRLDDCDPQNPDYPVAFTPAEFAQYIRNIRETEVMLGDGVKRIQPCEEAMLPYRV